MKYRRIYDSRYTTMVVGYEFDGGVIYKDARTNWNGNEIVDGWEVCTGNYERVFYASTLKEAKAFVENKM